MKNPFNPTQSSSFDFPEISYAQEHLQTQPVPLKERPRQVRIEHEMAILRAHHERIARKIEVFWGHPECMGYIKQLILDGADDTGRTRFGFKSEVLSALINLSNLHQIADR